MDIEKLIELNELLCECEDDIDVTCPACVMASIAFDAINKMATISEALAVESKLCKEAAVQLNEIKRTNQNLITRHSLHVESLNMYWHLLHKDCPCSDGGKCESIWESQTGHNHDRPKREAH